MPKVTRETPLTGKTKDGQIISEATELFCQNYILEKGNGTEAAMKSFRCKNRNSAAFMASTTLKDPKVLKRINELVDKHIMTDIEADFELTKVIRQDADFAAKNKGLEIFNKLKGRYKDDNEQKKTVIQLNPEKVELIKEALKEI